MRPEVVRLIEDLESTDDRIVQRALRLAGQWLPHAPEGSLRVSAEGMDVEPIRASAGGVLHLSDTETDAIVRRLLEHVREGRATAPIAAWALHGSGRLDALPTLALALRRWSPESGWSARQAIIAIQDILDAAASTPSGGLTDPEILRQVQAALTIAASDAVQDGSGARQLAREALSDLQWDHRTQPS